MAHRFPNSIKVIIKIAVIEIEKNNNNNDNKL